jgi:hypothetical protein
MSAIALTPGSRLKAGTTSMIVVIRFSKTTDTTVIASAS